jgi:4-amino-4-deoxy-L-arabinose transferase-like glycosyltransferase
MQRLSPRARAAAWLDAPRFVLVILLGATVLRLVWIALFRAEPDSDFAWYVTHAATLARGGDYADGSQPTAYFPPGYPYFLSLVFRLAGIGPWPILLANIALQVLAIGLVYRLARDLFQSERVGRIALLMYALLPNNIAYSALPASENLFVPLMLLGAWLLLRGSRRWGWLIPAGLVIGAAALVRPQAVLILVAYFLVTLPGMLRARQGWRWLAQGALVVALTVAVVLPWLARNAARLGKPVMTTTGGLNLYIGHNRQASGTYMMTAWHRDTRARQGGELAIDAAFRRQAQAEMREQPLRALLLVPLRLFWLFAFDMDGAQWVANSRPVGAGRPFLMGWMVLSQVAYMAVWAGAVLAWGAWRPLPWLGVAIIGAFTLVYLALYGMARYHQPMTPWLIMYAAAWAVARSATASAGAAAPAHQAASGR